ncbi:MAG: response regulator transcription factor [Cytophagales bacterium]|nr:response regulator transcription factor [Cytophagales bacterium]MDW8383576.1 response regulator transcription factor [Flammeovirgaceae bacterium]
MNKHKILLVEDDPNLGQVLSEYLEIKGYVVVLCKDGETGLKAFKKEQFDLLICDVMMPKMDGYTLVEEVRLLNADIPIIFVTAKSMKEDAIHGFRVGADDYVTKPFSMEELLMRIKAILKRSSKANAEQEQQEVFYIGKTVFDYKSQRLVVGKNEYKLTTRESDLLKMLCLSKNQVLDRSKALKKIWLDDNYFNSRSMDVYVTKLRKYLKGDTSIQILNVHGQGFKLVELDNKTE